MKSRLGSGAVVMLRRVSVAQGGFRWRSWGLMVSLAEAVTSQQFASSALDDKRASFQNKQTFSALSEPFLPALEEA